jgi:hypothetical protein
MPPCHDQVLLHTHITFAFIFSIYQSDPTLGQPYHFSFQTEFSIAHHSVRRKGLGRSIVRRRTVCKSRSGATPGVGMYAETVMTWGDNSQNQSNTFLYLSCMA